MKKSVLVLVHLLFWSFTALAIPYLFNIVWLMTAHFMEAGSHKKFHIETAYTASTILLLIGAFIFYTSYVSLKVFVKRPIRFIWILSGYVAYTLVVSLPSEFISYQAAVVLGPVLYFNVSGFLFKACVEWFKDRQVKVELEKDRDARQLELLKSKIDPHFLFNNLNNIDVFIQEDPKLASDYLKKLSEILRFMLYESNTEKILLSDEIGYIRKYVDLQKIRTSNTNFVKMEISGNIDHKKVSPMILIHFIENAFKYASNKKIEDAVVIRFMVSGKRLSFSCRNHISLPKEMNPEKMGMGIQLLRQKLDLMYKKDYTLVTKEENNWYIVHLDIQMDED